MKKKMLIMIGVLGIVLVTILLLVMLPGTKRTNSATDETTEKPSEITLQPVTEQPTEKPSEPGPVGKLTESGPDRKTEEQTEEKTQKQTEEAPKIDGAGEHRGKLGSVFTIPEGFYDVSPKPTDQGYYYSYEHPEYGMRIQIAEYHEEKLPVSFHMQYSVFHNLYKNDSSTRVFTDEDKGSEYVISGYLGSEEEYFYLKGMKKLDRNVVQITAQYPDGEHEDECEDLLSQILDSYDYQFVSNPDQKQEERNTLPEDAVVWTP